MPPETCTRIWVNTPANVLDDVALHQLVADAVPNIDDDPTHVLPVIFVNTACPEIAHAALVVAVDGIKM